MEVIVLKNNRRRGKRGLGNIGDNRHRPID